MDYRIPKNHVLVEVDFLRHKKNAFSNDTEIIIDPSFHPEAHANIKGTVEATPESIYFNTNDVMESSQFLTDITIKKGDTVYFHYLQINYAIKHRKIINRNGKFLIFVSHDSLFLAIRDGEVIMQNGWMLLEPIERLKNNKYIDTLPKDRQTKDPLRGRIVIVGGEVKEYFYGDETDKDIKVKEGDEVIFLPHSDIPLEYAMHESLNKTLYRVQRKELLAVILN